MRKNKPLAFLAIFLLIVVGVALHVLKVKTSTVLLPPPIVVWIIIFWPILWLVINEIID